MKTRHKTHSHFVDRTDPVWAERVEREAERHTAAAELRWRKALERHAAAEKRLIKEQAKRKPNRKLTDRLRALVNERLDELAAIQREMKQSPAGSQNRGKGSYRGVPNSETI